MINRTHDTMEKIPLPLFDMTLAKSLKLHNLLPEEECDIWEDRFIGTFPCDVHIFKDNEQDNLIHVEIYRSYTNKNGTRSTDCSTFYGGYDYDQKI